MIQNKKGLVWLLIPLFIVVVLGGYFVYSRFQKSSSPTGQTRSIILGAGVLIQQGKQLCQPVQEYGSKFNWLTLSWQRIQPANKNQWVWKQMDNWVDGYRACGQEIGVHILSDAGWAIKPFPPEIQDKGNHSMPAKNTQTYYDFVYQVAAHYKGRITRYSIENEAHWPGNWGGSADEYMTILQAAYKAIHAADPGAIVEDAAMSHEGLGYLTANWLVSQGKIQEALDFANNYTAHYYKDNPVRFNSLEELKTVLSTPGVLKTIDWENKLFVNHKYYDHMQIHNGAPWQELVKVLEYVHSNLQAQGDDKILDWWEGWYSWTGAPGNGFNPQLQAQDIVKQMVVGFAGNVDRFVYWTFTDFAIGEGHPGLVDNQGNPRPAATSFKITSEKLGGSINVQKLNLGEGVFVYKFSKKGKDVFVVWSSSDDTVQLPFAGGATITDIQGNSSKVNSNRVPVGISPIFIESE